MSKLISPLPFTPNQGENYFTPNGRPKRKLLTHKFFNLSSIEDYFTQNGIRLCQNSFLSFLCVYLFLKKKKLFILFSYLLTPFLCFTQKKKKKKQEKINYIFWSLFFTQYFNLIFNLLIMSIWSLIFQCHVNLVHIVIYWMKIVDIANAKSKILVYCHINKS